jgi:hypothetical protein
VGPQFRGDARLNQSRVIGGSELTQHVLYPQPRRSRIETGRKIGGPLRNDFGVVHDALHAFSQRRLITRLEQGSVSFIIDLLRNPAYIAADHRDSRSLKLQNRVWRRVLANGGYDANVDVPKNGGELALLV